eukprot:357008-Chlamydomonas_euryale.AAC.3
MLVLKDAATRSLESAALVPSAASAQMAKRAAAGSPACGARRGVSVCTLQGVDTHLLLGGRAGAVPRRGGAASVPGPILRLAAADPYERSGL